MNNPINEWLDEGMNVDIRLRPEGHPVTVVVEDPNDARVQWAGHGETLTHATSDAILDERQKEKSRFTQDHVRMVREAAKEYYRKAEREDDVGLTSDDWDHSVAVMHADRAQEYEELADVIADVIRGAL